MDSKTQLALADQLRRLGMPEKSAAVLRRLRGGRSRDERTELQIAQAFLSSNDKEAAAEVAYTVLRRIGSGRGTSSNVASYRKQAVSILKSVGRLDPLIEQAKRRVTSAPASIRARIELADLYTAAGKKQDADDLWTEIAKDQPGDPRQLIARASSLYKAKKYKEAASLYLDAFEKDTQLFNRHAHEMSRAVEQGKDFDEMFERLTEFNPESIPGYRIDTLIRVGRNRAYTDAKRKFIARALENTQVKRDFYRYINAIPVGERKKIPAVRETKGRLVGVASVMGRVALSGSSPYVASKFAVIGLCETLRLELHGTGVSITTILPGLVESDIGKVDNNGEHRPEWEDRRPKTVMWPTDRAAKVMAKATIRKLPTPSKLNMW